MDPKALSNLDPKLRETYERVMGTTSTTTSPDAAAMSTAQNTPTVTDGGAQISATAPDAVTPSPAPAAQLSAPPVQPVNPWQNQPTGGASTPNPFTPTGQALPSPASVAGPKEASPMLRVLYIIGAVVFFGLYTVFWIKVFKLPFLF